MPNLTLKLSAPMKGLKSGRNTFLGILVAGLALPVASPIIQTPSTQISGEIVDGLEMSLSIDPVSSEPGKAPKFRVGLHNAGERDQILNLGMMLTNGEKQFPDAVVLILTDLQSQKVSRLVDLREPMAIDGRVDPLIVPLPIGATFSIPVDLDNYSLIPPDKADHKLKPGQYSLEAQFTGKTVSLEEANLDVKGIALMRYWKGTVTSNEVGLKVLDQGTSQSRFPTLTHAERLASDRDVQISESGSFLEINVNSPRPLDDVLTALAKKYGWRINYEDPQYQGSDVVEVTTASWLRQHPEGPYAYSVGGGAFSAKIPLRDGFRNEPARVIAAVVKAYNDSGNPGRFELRSSNDKWFDVVPTAADGPQRPILDTPIGFQATPPHVADFSLQVLCQEVTLRSGSPVRYYDFSGEHMYLAQQVQQRWIELHAPDRPAREALREMLQESLTTSWRVYYDPNIRGFMLQLRSDAW